MLSFLLKRLALVIPTFVGITLSVQGYAAVGTSCLGFLDLSDTIDFTIR